ncbi:hypothetical protein ACH0R4_RS05170 [Bacillus cytotoxicus]|uniref:hypothetical protein n=1 Tax=Bacillus cereus group sp. BfR-BA-01492 TaxID=2920361 RepID=UPI001F59FB19|nr:hypothetical protein [Bacillus cereus group sp. BfR-BA-01492]EMA6342831.1 hypothetical protein [Bacillus cytotoxicus]
MISKLKVFGGNVLASLVASFIFLYIPLVSQNGNSVNSIGLENIINDNKFLINWILIFTLISTIRWFIRRRIDKLQTPYPIGFVIGNSYNSEAYNEAYGFNWKVYADVKHRDPFKNEILDVHVGQVDGPYCKNDDREMKISRTYFGRYKYKCPKCGYKKILLKNRWTLECDIKDELEAQYRSKLNSKNRA